MYRNESQYLYMDIHTQSHGIIVIPKVVPVPFCGHCWVYEVPAKVAGKKSHHTESRSASQTMPIEKKNDSILDPINVS